MYVKPYPQVIYPTVMNFNNRPMEDTEHWRKRLLELQDAAGLKQVEMADAIGVEPSYYSRLRYPPGKPGRKNMGIETLRATIKAFNLRPDWFDLPLGSHLPNRAPVATTPPALPAPTRLALAASEPRDEAPRPAITWPFREVSYQRLKALQEQLGPKHGAEALRDLDSLLDAAVIRWERRAAQLSKRAG